MKKTPRQWLKEPKYNHIKSVDFKRGSQYFEATENPNKHKMDEPQFRSRLKMADIRYKTETFRKRPMKVQAAKMPVTTMFRTLYGQMMLQKGDYIVYNDGNENGHPMRAETFKKIYEKV